MEVTMIVGMAGATLMALVTMMDEVEAMDVAEPIWMVHSR
jgi:hypothetical protein